MSVCTFIASDFPLKEAAPEQEYPLEINVDSNQVFDGGADDNFFLFTFPDVGEYTNKKHGVCLEWNYTDGRADRIIAYMQAALQETDAIELWHVWLTDYYEYEERPFIHRRTIPVRELTAECIKDIDNADVWNKPDREHPNRPSFYCLTVTR